MPEFEKIISNHCIRLYRLCAFIVNKKHKEYVLNRRFLGRLHMESTWMEETMDAAGARHNEKWFPFREGVSAIKLFSEVAYDGIHVKKSFPHYSLIEIENKFVVDTDNLLEDLYCSLVKSSEFFIKKSKKCNIHKDDVKIDPNEFIDIDDCFPLPDNRKLRHIDKPGKTLIYLSTEFINLKVEMKLFNNVETLSKKDYKNYIPESVSEEKLRLMLVRFHNLQSLYDTYLSDSNIESVDSRLKVLRGHISFIYHLLTSATQFSHYYERHIIPRQTSLFYKSLLPMDIDRFLEITINYFIKYSISYFKAATDLCHNVIDTYAEICEKNVPIPEYRGFHVRPSSLVSKIVNYYGGSVKLIVRGVEYDPSTPLDLFRVNEEINAIKRKKLFEIVHNEYLCFNDLPCLLNNLEENGVIVIYDKSIEDITSKTEDESINEFLKRSFAFLLASGKIDIKMDITVKFIGDMRSLEDIALLASTGYGEDKYGTNIMLPKKLSYLKR